MIKHTVEVEIGEEPFLQMMLHATHEDAVDLIMNSDQLIADAGFTDALIRKLAKSLRGDMHEQEWDDLVSYMVDLK